MRRRKKFEVGDISIYVCRSAPQASSELLHSMARKERFEVLRLEMTRSCLLPEIAARQPNSNAAVWKERGWNVGGEKRKERCIDTTQLAIRNSVQFEVPSTANPSHSCATQNSKHILNLVFCRQVISSGLCTAPEASRCPQYYSWVFLSEPHEALFASLIASFFWCRLRDESYQKSISARFHMADTETMHQQKL